jgi:Rho GDP-dissociation inhibitor
VDGRPDIVIDLKTPGAVDSLKDKPFTIKEGAQFRMKAVFKVQHEILAGLKYVQVVKRMGVSHKMQEMMGSYGPSTEEKPVYEKKCKPGHKPQPAHAHANKPSQSSPRPHRLAWLAAATTKPSPSLSTTTM